MIGTKPDRPRLVAVDLVHVMGTETYKVIGGDVSRSGDLGYTHGTFDRTSADEPKKIEHGSYIRIWQKNRTVWEVVIDVTNIAQ